MEKTLEFDIKRHYLFIEFKTAYDSLNMKIFFKVMQEMGNPWKSHYINNINHEK